MYFFNYDLLYRCALITWSKDYTLRFWNMDIELQQKCGHVVEDLEIERAEDFEPNVIDASQPCDIQRSHSFFEIEEEETVVIASPHSRGQSIPPMIEGTKSVEFCIAFYADCHSGRDRFYL